jgi:hypothetical protein
MPAFDAFAVRGDDDLEGIKPFYKTVTLRTDNPTNAFKRF